MSDDDFFDTPRFKTNETKQNNLTKKENSPSNGSSATLSAAKPPTHPNSVAKKARRVEGSDSEEEHNAPPSPILSTHSGSTVNSRRVIHAKVPTAELDNEYEEADEYGSQDLDSASSDEGEEGSGRRTPMPTGGKAVDEREKYSAKRNSDGGSNPSKKDNGNVSKNGSKKIATGKTSSSSYLTDDDDDPESDADLSDTTDSDVTEVSPLNSPKRPPAAAGSAKKSRRVSDPPMSNTTERQDNKSGHVDIDRILRANKDTMDFRVLLQAVLDIENEGPITRGRHQPKQTNSPFPEGDFTRPRKNYSFNNDRVSTIDRENQRLLEKIIRRAKEAKRAKEEMRTTTKRKSSASAPSPPRRPTSSAINRSREQQKIEAENLAMLKRLQGTRPSKELQREVLIGEYKKHLVFSGAIPLSSLKGNESWSRPTSATPSALNVGRRSRPSSATQSAKRAAAMSSAAKMDRPQSSAVRRDSNRDYSDDE